MGVEHREPMSAVSSGTAGSGRLNKNRLNQPTFTQKMFREHQNKAEFQEVIRIVEVLAKPHLNDYDEEAIINYLR